jgi:redox-sensitive bicupin YhaK (pirin superfamily)
MITIHKASERGRTHVGWLDSWHSFSFGDYFDPENMGFRSLRVLNDDRVAPGTGFGMHPHRDMEILTWVLSGELEHRDSLGSGGVIRPGDLQRMTAGTGIRHSEVNPSADEPVHLLQVWIQPEKKGLPPSYEQKTFQAAERRGRLQHLAGPSGADGAVTIRQDADLFATLLDEGEQVTHTLRPGQHAWVHVATGSVRLNGTTLAAGDAAAVSEEKRLTLAADGPAEVLVFDLA